MSTVDLATPTAIGMSLGNLVAEAVEQPSETEMANESAAVSAPEPVVELTAKAKKPRKTPVKKEKAVAKEGENGEADTGDAEVDTPTKVKKPRKTPVKKPKAAAKDSEDASGEAEEPTTPKAAAPKKRAPKKKADTPATPVTPSGGENGDVEMATPPATNGTVTKSSAKKRGPAKAANGETPTKKSKVTNGDTPGKRGTKFPECWAEFCEEDKLIVNMRRAGKKWEEIEPAWTEISGTVPGKDSLRKRFAKLEAVAQDFSDADIPKLVAAKKAIDADFIAVKEQMQVEQAAALKKMKDDQDKALKKQEAEKWAKISNHIKAAGGEEYKSFLIEKKFKALEKSGEVDANGNLSGAVDEDVVAEDEEAVDEDMENLSVADDTAATNGNGHVEGEEADAMEE